MARKKKVKIVLEYRWDGGWVPIGGTFPSVAAAQEYARTSQCCLSNGYQIRKIK